MSARHSRNLTAIATLVGLLVLAGCGGGSSSTPGNGLTATSATSVQNVQPLVVNSGPPGVVYVNGAFTSVTVCVPGSSSCQTIDNVLVDTGSMGLRIVSSALSLALPQQNDGSNSPIVECNQFIDGFTWGPLRMADVKMAGEQAKSVPIQVIGDPAFTTIPNACSSTGPSEDTVQTLGANGILGVGPFRQDCGLACSIGGSVNPGFYYSCPSASSCAQTTVTLAQQAQNPVWMFASDNNGVILELPTVPASGAPSVSGSLVFGIGTQANNGLGSAQVLALDANGNFTTVFNGQPHSGSFIDSGSNGLFFLDSATTGLPTCSGNNQFYCPASTQNLSATNQGTNGVNSTVSFSVANANTLLGNASDFVFSNLAGPNPGSFDWGLPFFLGRNVFTAIESQGTPAGTGPYFAY
jgi:hypothetical protein